MESKFAIECNKQDISSFSNFHEFKQEHIHIKKKIDFEDTKYFLFILFTNKTY